jgi:putative CocE/NonD family hydrolase
LSDVDTAGQAWNTPASAYWSTRPAQFAVNRKPRSVYVTMPDDIRIAVDAYLPEALNGGPARPARIPTIVIFTCYTKRFTLKPDAKPGTEDSPRLARYRDAFVPRGYAVVTVDVRGTGASYGSRDGFRSPREREDSKFIADWIVSQDWSDGAIGAVGISYGGAASDFIASTGHPAVKAIAPLFAVWDTYSDHYYPGGTLITSLVENYGQLISGLDAVEKEKLTKFVYHMQDEFVGPHPVDEDTDGSMAEAAVHEHAGNFLMPNFMREFRYRDSALPYDPNYTTLSFSPYGFAAGISPDVAIYTVSGWYDGAGYANGAIARMLTLPNPKKYMMLGPWDHAVSHNASPFRARKESEFPLMAEVLRFFDQYLMKKETGIESEDPIHYYCIRQNEWRASKFWPPVEQTMTLHLSEGGKLTDEPGANAVSKYLVDFALGTGAKTRYESIAAIFPSDLYSDWKGRTDPMLNFESAPLPGAMELTGHVVLSLDFAASKPDAVIHAYLSEIEPDGTIRYVTEGVLRALHRTESAQPENYKASWPYRSFARADARPLNPGEYETIRFALLPISWQLKSGSRLRLSIAGADHDHFEHIPAGHAPTFSIRHGAKATSTLTLPVRPVGKV